MAERIPHGRRIAGKPFRGDVVTRSRPVSLETRERRDQRHRKELRAEGWSDADLEKMFGNGSKE